MTDPRLTPQTADRLAGDAAAMDGEIRAALAGQSVFTWERSDGALVGPYPPLLHFPHPGRAVLEHMKAVNLETALPPSVREVVALVVGARLRSAYEVYAHTELGRAVGLDDTTIEELLAGGRPASLDAGEAVAHDVAHALFDGGPLPDAIYRSAVERLGSDGVAELVHLTANITVLAMLMNAYAVPIPDAAD